MTWEEYCLKKYNDEYKENRTIEDIEFSEEGGIYLHGIGGISFIGKYKEYSFKYWEQNIYNWEN